MKYSGVWITGAGEAPIWAVSRASLPHKRCATANRRSKKHRLSAAVVGNEGVQGDNVGSSGSEDDAKREKVSAKSRVMASVGQVWRVLTDYEELTEVIPFLEESKTLEYQNSRRLRIYQRAACSVSFWKLYGEGVLDVEERILPLGLREIRFKMIEGDFEEYCGRWLLEPGQNSNTCALQFDAVVLAKEDIPELVISTVVRSWLPLGIFSVARAAEKIAQKRASAPGFIAAAFEDDIQLRGAVEWDLANDQHTLAWAQKSVQAKRTSKWNPLCVEDVQHAGEEEKKRLLKENKRKKYLERAVQQREKAVLAFRSATRSNSMTFKGPSSYLGTSSVPLPKVSPPPAPKAPSGNAKLSLQPLLVTTSKKSECEVEARKLDVDGLLHRKVLATIPIKASRVQVWSVLSNYEHLMNILPNMEKSEAIKLAPGAPQRYRRLRQIMSKSEPYSQLKWQYDLDVVEQKFEEIQFRKFRSRKGKFQGKFIFSEGAQPDEAILKFSVEFQVPMDNDAMQLMDHKLESVIFEDLPHNLSALKESVESAFKRNPPPKKTKVIKAKEPIQSSKYSGQSVSTKEMKEDFELLQTVIKYHYGNEGENLLPSRKDLRADRLSTVEKAISAHGGMRKVAKEMGWKLKIKTRLPRGYWKNLSNIRTEVDAFTLEHNLAPGVMPSKKDFQKAGRNDIRRAIEKLGGLGTAAKALGLRMDVMAEDAEVERIHLKRLKSALESEKVKTKASKKMMLDIKDIDGLDSASKGDAL